MMVGWVSEYESVPRSPVRSVRCSAAHRDRDTDTDTLSHHLRERMWLLKCLVVIHVNSS